MVSCSKNENFLKVLCLIFYSLLSRCVDCAIVIYCLIILLISWACSVCTRTTFCCSKLPTFMSRKSNPSSERTYIKRHQLYKKSHNFFLKNLTFLVEMISMKCQWCNVSCVLESRKKTPRRFSAKINSLHIGALLSSGSIASSP